MALVRLYLLLAVFRHRVRTVSGKWPLKPFRIWWTVAADVLAENGARPVRSSKASTPNAHTSTFSLHFSTCVSPLNCIGWAFRGSSNSSGACRQALRTQAR